MIWVAGEIPATAVVSEWNKVKFPQLFTVSVTAFFVRGGLVVEIGKTIGHQSAEESCGFVIGLGHFNRKKEQCPAVPTFVTCPCNICGLVSAD